MGGETGTRCGVSHQGGGFLGMVGRSGMVKAFRHQSVRNTGLRSRPTEKAVQRENKDGNNWSIGSKRPPPRPRLPPQTTKDSKLVL